MLFTHVELSEEAMALINQDCSPKEVIDILQKEKMFLDLTHFFCHALPMREVIWWTVNSLEIREELLQKVKPHQVYAAGDLADPHGTHRVCLDAIFQSFRNLKKEKWMIDCWLWMYRGAWHEWGIHEIQMAVPLSPHELMKKRRAIFMHQSQKDSAPFPGSDAREFWQRAEDRNQGTAEAYDALGLPEYEAIEAFVRYHF